MEAFVNDFIKSEKLNDSFRISINRFFIPIIGEILKWKKLKSPLVIGVNGAQGTGKSTLSSFISNYLNDIKGLNTFVLSLDDLYLKKTDREELSNKINPLFLTRGVPGTHDIPMGLKIIEESIGTIKKEIKVPIFRKEIDDRAVVSKWRKLKVPLDVLIFEGWCVGAAPQLDSDLILPINDLEKVKDPNLDWRTYVNNSLKNEYAKMFKCLDYLIMLRPPNFDCIFNWRLEQENKLKLKLENNKDNSNNHFMDFNELRYFISHYERLTRWMLKDIPEKADILLDFKKDHSIDRIIFNS